MLALRLRLRRWLEDYQHTIPLGMASLVLGTLGLAFVFMPVLGIPITGLGIVLGVLGLLAGWLVGGRLALRWSAGGLAVGGLSMAMNIAVAYAPAGYWHGRPPPKHWQTIPGRAEVPAPAALTLEGPTLPAAERTVPTRPAQQTSSPPVARSTETPTALTRLPVRKPSESSHHAPPPASSRSQTAHPRMPPTMVLPPFAPTPTGPPTIPIPTFPSQSH